MTAENNTPPPGASSKPPTNPDRRAVPAIVRRHASATPVSFPQLRLWFLEQLEPENPLYHIAYAVRLRGALNLRALEQSLAEITRRHEGLRATFHPAADEPVQRVAPVRPGALPVIDLQAVPPTRRETEARRLVVEEVRQPFKLETGPLVRARLFQLGVADQLLTLVWHNIVFDGWSEKVFCAELNALYAAFCAGQPSPLPELPVQYADYATWQRERLRGPELDLALAYWKTKLAGQAEALELPTDRPEPPVRTLRGETLSATLDAATCAAVRRLSRETGSTPFSLLVAVVQALLYRYTGQEDITIGILTDGRTTVETEGLIGFFVNTLPARTDLSGNPTFSEALARASRTVNEAFAHGELPFEKMVEMLRPERALSRNPLFRVMFVFQDAPLPTLALPGLEAATEELFSDVAKFDLTLFVTDLGESFRLRAEYSTDLFDADTIRRLLRNFRQLLTSALARPEARLAELELLDANDREEVLVRLNETAAEFPRELCVHQLVEAQVERTPDAVAAVFAPQQLTYRELDTRAAELATYLRTLGVGPDTRVGLCVERSLEMLVGLLAILKAGGAYVPLDPGYPADRLAYMLKDSGTPVLLTQRKLGTRLTLGVNHTVYLDEPLPAATTPAPAAPVSPENLAYVIYTSGSTGQPKGVAMPHRALVNLLAWQRQDSRAGRGSRTAQFTSLSFDVSFQEIFSTWTSGGTLVLIAQTTRRDPHALWKLLADARVERLFLPFVALQQLAEVAGESELTPRQLREVITAGEQLQITKKMVALFERLPGCTLHNHYGPTESHVVTAHTLKGPPRSWPPLPSIGRPINNTRIHILDAHGQPTPVGVPGELHIGGDCLARGYLDQPDLTAAKFIPDPFAGRPGERLYRTGDLARYLADGSIEFLGRADHQVKLRGYRVELGEIENTLRRHPQVRDCVVVAREFSPGDKRLMAYLIVRDATAPTAAELAEHVRGALPDYMVPAAFVTVERFPLTPSGKVDRKSLAARQDQVAESPAQSAPPRTPIEEALAAIWREVLQRKQVGIHDNFFDLGGHSLLAIQVVDHVNKAGLGISLNQVFQHQTIAELASVADTNQTVESGSDEWFSLVTLQPKGERPPFFLVHTAPGDLLGYMRLVYHLGSDQPCYGFQSYGLLRQGAAHQTLEAMAAHYVRLMRQFQPEGPYYLGGWCFGGNVAMEMAWQLVDQGQKVALLAVAEGWALRPPLKYWRYYWHHFLCLAWSGPHGVFRRAWGKLRSPLERNPGTENRKQFAFETARTGPLVNREHVYKINLQATHNYRSRPAIYPGQVTLFLRENYGDGVVIAPDCGFASLARETETHLVPGDHMSVLHEPHVRSLAAKLKESLLKAQAQAGASGTKPAHGQPNA